MSPAVRASQKPLDAPLSKRTLRVLIVDDDRDVVVTMMTILRSEGHDTRGCHSGADALRHVDDYDPDVVLLDIALPGESGWDVARRIRERRGRDRPLLIGITGEYKKGSDRVLAQINGFDHYLIKPADPREIVALLDSAGDAAGS